MTSTNTSTPPSRGAAGGNFPPIRACLFDMDGLLLNTEDIYTSCCNTVLSRHGRPNLPWEIKAKLMGVPLATNQATFHSWAQLPIPIDQFNREQTEQWDLKFPECAPLPGVEKLLADLQSAKAKAGGKEGEGYPVQLALATSSSKRSYDAKTSKPQSRAVLDLIPESHKVYGDSADRVAPGRGKPLPDIYLAALAVINESLEATTPEVPKITPAECLVFEDSVVGVEAGRRAGMQVVWCPHPGLGEVYKGQEAEVLAGRIGLVEVPDAAEEGDGGKNGVLGELDDGWGVQLKSLEDFPYEMFGMVVE